MLRCYITDRHQAGGEETLFTLIRRALAVGIELIQIREKDWDTRSLSNFVSRVMRLPNPHESLVLVNGRPDVALACGAHGVHLSSTDLAPSRLRHIFPARFVIGVSCHSREAMNRALEEDADYVFVSPVFRPLSKSDSRPPLGLDGLQSLVAGYPIPSFALGGITPDTMHACISAGTPGVAGISLFQKHLLLHDE